MVKAWYMNDDSGDHRLEHHKDPPELVSLEELYSKTGVEHFALNVTTYQTDGILDQIKKERGYTYEDELVCVKGGEDLEEVTKKFYKEHLHSEEETRFIYEGSGYFDVRDGQDRWIRVSVRAGDLVVLPSGIYHRFTLDTNEHVKMKRFFVGYPEWCGYNRPSDDMACRRQYLSNQQRGFPQLKLLCNQQLL